MRKIVTYGDFFFLINTISELAIVTPNYRASSLSLPHAIGEFTTIATHHR